MIVKDTCQISDDARHLSDDEQRWKTFAALNLKFQIL